MDRSTFLFEGVIAPANVPKLQLDLLPAVDIPVDSQPFSLVIDDGIEMLITPNANVGTPTVTTTVLIDDSVEMLRTPDLKVDTPAVTTSVLIDDSIGLRITPQPESSADISGQDDSPGIDLAIGVGQQIGDWAATREQIITYAVLNNAAPSFDAREPISNDFKNSVFAIEPTSKDGVIVAV
jgi:hypothetical protein